MPGLDILNRSFAANTTFEARSGGCKQPTAFTAVTTRAIQKGGQACGCYGRIAAAHFDVEVQLVTKAVLQNDVVRCSTASLATVATMLRYWKVARKTPRCIGSSSAIAAYLQSCFDGTALAAGTVEGQLKRAFFGGNSAADVEAHR
ncbi:hypothetical protein IOCL2690_000838100 [Leishmania lindenbergi]|uniref:Leishmanolysin n=1 Tax=Leishmania lindenbergi TaxID=651832 RepID=A0AAW2ZTH0_9TRYP